MPAAAFLALLAIALLLLAALRLELNFRRRSKKLPEGRRATPELRMTPAAGYCQASLSGTA
jgi:hypothetical protein